MERPPDSLSGESWKATIQMALDPGWILFTLRDLRAFAGEHCRSEVALHLEAAERHIKPYLSLRPPAVSPDPEVQTAGDILAGLVRFARRHDLPEMRLHLLAAQRKLLETETPSTAETKVITFPVASPGSARKKLR